VYTRRLGAFCHGACAATPFSLWALIAASTLFGALLPHWRHTRLLAQLPLSPQLHPQCGTLGPRSTGDSPLSIATAWALWWRLTALRHALSAPARERGRAGDARGGEMRLRPKCAA
jgi:hypothetical protein